MDTENRVMVARGERGGELGAKGEVQTGSYKIVMRM